VPYRRYDVKRDVREFGYLDEVVELFDHDLR
jgi:hypothetical protein